MFSFKISKLSLNYKVLKRKIISEVKLKKDGMNR